MIIILNIKDNNDSNTETIYIFYILGMKEIYYVHILYIYIYLIKMLVAQ